MPWSGGNFTRANGNNGWVTDQTDGIGIEAGRHDTQDNDFKEGINFCLAKDGSNSATGNLNLGNNKITALGTATATTDAMPYGMIRDGAPLFLDKTNNRLGINTSTPVDTLEVASTSFFPQYISTYVNSAGGANIVIRRSRGATIGTNTILQNNDIVGSLGFQGANGSTFTACATIGCAVDGVPGATNDMPGRLTFETTADGSGSATERMRINSAGQVLIGTTNPAYLQGTGSCFSNTGNLWISRNGGIPLDLNRYDDGQIVAFVRGAPGATGAVGNIAISAGGTTYNSTSDYRLKHDVTPIVDSLQKVCVLNPVEYKWNIDDSNGQGFLAHELAEIIPYAVTGSKDAVDENNQPVYQGVDYGKLTPLLAAAIKELNAKVEALQARVAELEK